MKLKWRENGGDLDQDTSLHFAAASGRYQLLFNSLTLGCDINSTNYMGWTPLMQAARNSQTTCVRLLLDFGADVSIKNHFGICALSLAAASGSLETVSLILKYCIQKGVEISEVEKHISPVFFSVIFNHIDILRYLHKYSYSLNKTIPLGDLTPVAIASILNQKELLSYFKRRGIMAMTINVQSPLLHSVSPLHNPLFFKSTPSSCRTAHLSPNISNIPTIAFNSPISLASTPFNTPEQASFCLTPVPNSMLEIRKRRSSNFVVPVPTTPSLSPIINGSNTSYKSACSQLTNSNHSNSLFSNASSNNIMNSRIKPTSLTFSSTSSNDNSQSMLDSNNYKIKNSNYRSASCNVPVTPCATTSELVDDVFVLSPIVINNNNRRFVELLRKNSLDSCISLFAKHEIDMELFLTLSKSDLEEIGVDWDKRDNVLEVIYQCNQKLHGGKKRNL